MFAIHSSIIMIIAYSISLINTFIVVLKIKRFILIALLAHIYSCEVFSSEDIYFLGGHCSMAAD